MLLVRRQGQARSMLPSGQSRTVGHKAPLHCLPWGHHLTPSYWPTKEQHTATHKERQKTRFASPNADCSFKSHCSLLSLFFFFLGLQAEEALSNRDFGRRGKHLCCNRRAWRFVRCHQCGFTWQCKSSVWHPCFRPQAWACHQCPQQVHKPSCQLHMQACWLHPGC